MILKTLRFLGHLVLLTEMINTNLVFSKSKTYAAEFNIADYLKKLMFHMQITSQWLSSIQWEVLFENCHIVKNVIVFNVHEVFRLFFVD